MFARRRSHDTATTETVRGPSLARGPAWIVGLVLSIAGLALFFRAPGTPLTTAGFPDGVASGDTFLGFEANAWTAWLTTAAGILVLIGAAQHTLARALSLITGLALGAMAVIALVDGDDVLGLAAANGWTALAWGIASAVLLVTALLPRVKRERTIDTTDRDRVAERDNARIADRDRARTSDRETVRSDERHQAPVATPTAVPAAASHTDRDAPVHGTLPADDSRRHDEPTTVQPAATTSGERSDDAPPVRSAPLRHTYEPRTHESETTAGTRSAEEADAETRTHR